MVVSILLALVASLIMSRALVDDRTDAATSEAYLNARLLRSRLDPLPDDPGALLGGLDPGGGGGALLEVDGQWYSTSLALERDQVPGDLRALVEGGDVARQRVPAGDAQVLVVGVPIASAGARYYQLTSLAETDAAVATMRRVLAGGAVVATAVGAVVGVLLSGGILRPLRQVAAVARRIVGGETGSRLDVKGDADLEPLADAFNEMLDALDERVVREAAFASDVSHELRGPLTTLAAAVHVVNRRRDELPPDLVAAVDTLDEQVHGFNELVLDLLEISRLDAGTARLEPRPVDLAALCRAVADERGHAVPVEVDPAGAPVVASVDPRRIQQVVANLLDNAARYGGGAVRVGVIDSDDAVRVEVDDAGPGLSPAERESVFGRFVRGEVGRRASGGTGLGLALSRRHAELHGATLHAEDRPGGGARFVLELPKGEP